MREGFIKLYHKFIDTSFYKYPNCAHLALHLLLSANWQDNKTIWNRKEMTIKRGQLITGRLSLSQATGISEQSIRTCLRILGGAGFISQKSTNKSTIITICKYNDYQNIPTSKLTNQQPTNNQPVTTIEDVKEVKNTSLQRQNAFVIPTAQEVELYAKEQGFDIDGSKFLAHYGASSWMRGKTKITNWKLCAQTWKRSGS